MNSRKLFPLYFIVLVSIFSCKPTDAIVDAQTGERIFGWKNAKYIIGDSIKITLKQHTELYNTGIYCFQQGRLSNIILRRVEPLSTLYSTNIGIAIGDSISFVESKYGKPLKRSGNLFGGGRPIAEIEGLEYKRWGFIADSSGTKVELIILYDKKVEKKKVFTSIKAKAH